MAKTGQSWSSTPDSTETADESDDARPSLLGRARQAAGIPERAGGPTSRSTGPSSSSTSAASSPSAGSSADRPTRTRKAQLRLVHIDPWSVMKTAFLLSIALGIVAIVAVFIVWTVLGSAGVWSSIDNAVNQTVNTGTGSTTFSVTHYVGTSRAVGFTMIAAVIDVVLMTALATLAAFVYNLAATLLGGVEVTLAEDR